jgi:hypothetical protein
VLVAVPSNEHPRWGHSECHCSKSLEMIVPHHSDFILFFHYEIILFFPYGITQERNKKHFKFKKKLYYKLSPTPKLHF